MTLHRTLIWFFLCVATILGMMAIWIDLYQVKLAFSSILILSFAVILFISEPDDTKYKKNERHM